MTFRECAEEYHAANLTRWTNEKHRREWISVLRRFAFPVIGHLSVDVIDSGLVHKVLQPLVTAKAVTAATAAGPHRGGARLRQGGRTADRRQPGRQGRHQPHAADEKREGERHPSAGAAVRQVARAHAAPAHHARQGGAAARADHFERHANRRGAAGSFRGVRPCRQGLDDPGESA